MRTLLNFKLSSGKCLFNSLDQHWNHTFRLAKFLSHSCLLHHLCPRCKGGVECSLECVSIGTMTVKEESSVVKVLSSSYCVIASHTRREGGVGV
jgi:hypothetical protein